MDGWMYLCLFVKRREKEYSCGFVKGFPTEGIGILSTSNDIFYHHHHHRSSV
ncbi:hypothetical protein Scep_000207 [Stephania cephalantha]|uniref:Uncharacterized protein n=1 Tax=Stephania cephalantha TaxID=152367 RepID=A0AAP0L650_9MAGN